MKDLIVLAADKNMEYALKGILHRKHSLKIRPVVFDIKVHGQNDSGVYNDAHNFLRIYIDKYSYALVALDREGTKRKNTTAAEIAEAIQSNLDKNGWIERSKVIVLDPELEIWVWSDSPEVASCIGWNNDKHGKLADWLRDKQYVQNNDVKPGRPKEALEEALRIIGMPRSSSIYEKLAKNVGFNRCKDNAFQEFKKTLQSWFPVN